MVTSNVFDITVTDPPATGGWIKGVGGFNPGPTPNFPGGTLNWYENDYIEAQVDAFRVWTSAANVDTFTDMSNGGNGTNWASCMVPGRVPSRILISHNFPVVPRSHRTDNGGNADIYDRIASGEFDWAFQGAAQTFRTQQTNAGRDPNGGDLVISTHEMNGNWYPWAVFDKVTEWNAAYNRWALIFLNEMPDVRFEIQLARRALGLPYPGNSGVGVSVAEYLDGFNHLTFLTKSLHDNAAPYQVEDAQDFFELHVERTATSSFTWPGFLDIIDYANSTPGVRWGSTEWCPNLTNDELPNFPLSPAPLVFIQEFFDLCSANQANIGLDTYFSPSRNNLYSPSRQSEQPSILYKQLWY